MIEDFAKIIPSRLRNTSGSVFYSGRNAFSGNADLYILGVNPGGDPQEQVKETIEWHTRKVLRETPDDWSAYRDESWKGAAPGSWGMQPRVLYLFKKLECSAGDVPASNVIFQRSRRESNIKSEIEQLAAECWLFHEAVISALKPKAILCFGKTAGDVVRKRTGASMFIDEFVETNNRRWKSQAFENARGLRVIVATHPSIADWMAADSDPTNMILRVIRR